MAPSTVSHPSALLHCIDAVTFVLLMIAHGDRKAPCRAATCAPIRIIYQRRMVNALLSIVQRNCSRTFACVHSICGDIGAINDSIIAQHVNILRREASNGSVGSDRESIPHFGRPLHAPRVVSPPKSVSGILLWSIRSDLGGYTSKGGALVLNPCRDPVAKADLVWRLPSCSFFMFCRSKNCVSVVRHRLQA